MERETLKRYVIFLAALIVCAGVAWYASNASNGPQGDAVLASGTGIAVEEALPYKESGMGQAEESAGQIAYSEEAGEADGGYTVSEA